MTAPAPHSQPEAAALRQAQPVCCYCDNDLSCAQCGREQPYDDVSALRSRVEEAEAEAKMYFEQAHEFGSRATKAESRVA